MDSDVNAVTLFCEDFRQDTNGAYILTGVLSDLIVVSAFPAVLPRIGVFARLNIPLNFDVRQIQVRMHGPGVQMMTIGDFAPGMIKDAIDQASVNGSAFAGLMAIVVASPLVISEPGHLIVEAVIDNKVSIIGDLGVLYPPNASSPIAPA